MARLRYFLASLRRRETASGDFLLPQQDTGAKARYVAVIMDGNGRWAARRGLPAISGHREGARALKRVVKACRAFEVRELTVFAFSTENWKRSPDEVGDLMTLFTELIRKEVPGLSNENVKVRFIGRRQALSEELLDMMKWAEELTAGNTAMTLFVAFNYGGRAEIEDALRAAISNGACDTSSNEEIDFRHYLYAPEMHDPELLIRTSGERRISNFLLWQCAYSELHFSDKLWPDFDVNDVEAALRDFSVRQRRFGAR